MMFLSTEHGMSPSLYLPDFRSDSLPSIVVVVDSSAVAQRK